MGDNFAGNTWPLVRLGDLAEIRYGKAKPTTRGKIPVIGSGGLYDFTDKPLTDQPTLVIGRKGTAGTVWLQETACWPSDTTFYVDWRSDQIENRFAYYSSPPASSIARARENNPSQLATSRLGALSSTAAST